MKAIIQLTRCSSLGLFMFAGAVCLAQKSELVVQAWHTNSVNSVAFNPDGRMILSASDDHTLKLWDVATGRLIRTFKGHADEVTRAVFSPDGRLMPAVSGRDCRVWVQATGK